MIGTSGDHRVTKLDSEVPDHRTFARVWLTRVAFYYPIFWASLFLLHVFPALVRAALLGHRLKFFEVSFLYAFAASAPPARPGDLSSTVSSPHRDALADIVLVVSVTVLLLSIVARRHPAATGLASAVLGHMALLRMYFLRETTPKVLPASVFLFAVLCLGLRWMLASDARLRYWERVGRLLAALALPPVALVALMSIGGSFRIPIRTFVVWAPLAAASLLVSLRPPRRAASRTSRTGWRAVGLGLATTLLVVAGVGWGGRALNQAFERRRLAANQADLAPIPAIPPDSPYPKIFFQKGVNFTAEFPDIYASEGARRMLETLPDYGVNAVALVPYGWSRRNSPLVHLAGGGSWESDEGLEEMSRVAHARGMKVLLKPGLWVEGGYGGDLKFASPEDRAQWFEQYGLFLEHYARLAKRIHADLFSVGGEFPKLAPYDAEWRKLIALAREFYPGPLVYAANFDEEFENIKFWDALDYIGLQEYYPLPDDFSTEVIVQKVEAIARKFERPVIFTEAGFPSRRAPNRQPWNDSSGKVSPDDQARCYEAVLRAFYEKPWFQGVYWWKVGTNGFGGPEDGSHTPWGKPAMKVVRRWYLEGGR